MTCHNFKQKQKIGIMLTDSNKLGIAHTTKPFWNIHSLLCNYLENSRTYGNSALGMKCVFQLSPSLYNICLKYFLGLVNI